MTVIILTVKKCEHAEAKPLVLAANTDETKREKR
jgi:hypothetical protein